MKFTELYRFQMGMINKHQTHRFENIKTGKQRN